MDKVKKDKYVRPEETRTSATVTTDDLAIMSAIAKIKYQSDPLNSAWKRAVHLFIKENLELLKDKIDIVESK